jgi:hypothetical protein
MIIETILITIPLWVIALELINIRNKINKQD